jgi:DNA-binding response OmpR family regulator
MKILLVEDDQRLGKLIKEYLMPESELIDVINNGAEIRDMLVINDYDILILDVMLPSKNGIDICRELRAENVNIAILFITALNKQTDKIKAFESGADDYLIKPFDFQELLLRVKALTRREKKARINSLKWGDLVMIPLEKKVYFLNEELILTPKEFKILQIFLQYPQQVFTTDNIINKLWDDIDNIPTNNTLRSHIKSLRRKFEQVGLGKDFIETVYGMGYKLREFKSSSEQEKNAKNRIDNPEKQKLEELIEEIWEENRSNIYQDCQKLRYYIKPPNQVLDKNEAIRIAHNLAGFLGSVGFEKASEIAKQIEIFIQNNEDHLTNENIVNQVIKLINNLEKYLFPDGTPVVSENDNINLDFPEKIDLLVIDEDQNLANQFILFIEHPQIILHFAHTIESAIKYLEEQKFNLIIIETCWQNKPIEETKILELVIANKDEAQIIVYTKNETLANRLYCADYPIFAFLSKANSLEVLWENIKNALLQTHKKSSFNKIYDLVIIDDDKRFIQVLEKKLALQKLPIQLHTVSDSETFLTRIKTIKPNLIILDLKMPKLNGLDICKIIKTDPFLQNIPVIFLTGYLTLEVINQFVEVGADDFISKSKIDLELQPRIMTHLKKFNYAY